MTKSFVHLHLHTEYSMLDGAARIKDVVATAAADGQPAVGITDHGNMYGVLDFYKAAREADLTPVIGTEAYMVTTSRFDRPRRDEHDIFHLTVLAETNEGYRNLIKLSSHAYLDGYYYKPRVDFELLERHAKGLVATTGCLGGAVSQRLLADDYAGAAVLVDRFQSVFGRDSFFVELQDHGLPEQDRVNPQLIRLSRELRAPLLATNDSHYTDRHDAESHAALLCVQTGSTLDDPNRFKFDADEFYLKSAAEMRALFADYEEACDNTLLIAERANVDIEFGNTILPSFETPQGHDENSYLRELALEGARVRYGDTPSAEVIQRLDHELGVIKSMGFSAYFLVVWDLYRYARTNGIRVGPGRGSAAGSCVAFCLRITDIDPIRYDLLFERMLNPGRKQMPDIDMDFDSRFRGEMIRYAAERYGWDHVAQVVTFSTIKARAAVRDSARVLGYPYAVGDKIAKLMPPLVMGRDTPLRACLEVVDGYADGYKMASELRVLYEADPDAKRVLDVARGLEGLRRQDGIHAAAVVITREPLTEYLPIQRKPEAGGAIEDAPIVTQYEMHGVEDLGLLKMDFLGLRNLDVMEITLDLIKRSTGVRPDIDAVPLDDEKTLEMLRRGDTVGVFQLEGGPVRALLRSLRPTQFEDIAALVALYRPGPMGTNMHTDYADRKNGRKPVTYYHADVEDVLAPTYGLMIYQEQLMRCAQRLAGYSLEEADQLRYAAAKKKRDLMRKERSKFVAGCIAQGHTEQFAEQMFGVIEPFADYSFPKAHATGYGLIVYQTAYLKANHPVEYLAALLTSVKTNKDQTAIFLNECRQMGIDVLVPDVNESESDFSVHPSPDGGRGGGLGQVRFGMSAVRNVGEGVVAQIVAARRIGRAIHRLLRLLRPRRPRGAQQADDRVVGESRRLRFARSPAPGSRAGVRDDRRHRHRSAPQRGGRPVRPVLGGWRRAHRGGRRASGRDPRRRVRQVATAPVREGDARALRQRSPAHGRGALAAPPRRRHARRVAGSPRGRTPGRGWHRHVVRDTVDAAGRPDGVVRARGPHRRARGDGLPAHDDRVRPRARERRDRRGEGTARPARRHADAGRDGDHATGDRDRRRPAGAHPREAQRAHRRQGGASEGDPRRAPRRQPRVRAPRSAGEDHRAPPRRRAPRRPRQRPLRRAPRPPRRRLHRLTRPPFPNK